MWSRILTVAVVALAALVAPAGAHADTQEPTRILIVGDSVTNGSVGDWTWRYRLWNNLVGPGGADVDFVGPNTGVLDAEADTVNAMEYADPDFDVDHAARWGMSFAFPDHPPAELVEEYDADVVVEMLGLNDLTWLQGSPEVVADIARRWVGEMRSVNPEVSVVLTELPQDWIVKVSEYNVLLEQVAADLDEPGARVVVAEAPVPFVLDSDTWDIGHPSATGEVKIARSVAEALEDVGVGSAPEAFPEVVNGPPVPPVMTVRKQRGGITGVWWSMPLGATGVQVWQRRPGWPWERVLSPGDGLGPGERALVRVRAFKGSAVSPLWSNVVGVAGSVRGRLGMTKGPAGHPG